MATGQQILDDLNAVYERLYPTLWYIVTDMVPAGKMLKTSADDFFPEVHYFHPDDWAHAHRELTDAGFRLRDYRGWRPKGAPAPNVVEGETE